MVGTCRTGSRGKRPPGGTGSGGTKCAVRYLALRGAACVTSAAPDAVAPPFVAGPAAAGQLCRDAAGAAECRVLDTGVLPQLPAGRELNACRPRGVCGPPCAF